MTGGRVVVIGDALIDELRDDAGVREFVGGAALNVAVGLSRLGVPTTLIAMVGDDVAGAHIRAYLADFRVELLASHAPYGSARAVSTRSGAGEPTYVFNPAARARRIHFEAPEREAMADAVMIAISGFPFDDAAQTRELAEGMREGDAVLAIDPNPRSGLLSDRTEFVNGFVAIAAGAALVKVGEDDAALLYGEPLDALRERLVNLGVRAVLATEGAGGATLEVGADAVTRPISSLPGRIIDTMGAGDAAFASVIASWYETAPVGTAEWGVDDWGAALQRAMDIAAATCRFEGALLRLPSALADLDPDSIGT